MVFDPEKQWNLNDSSIFINNQFVTIVFSVHIGYRTRPIICKHHEWLSEQQDEDAEGFNYDIELPATINGQAVYGVEDEFKLAEELPEPLNDDEMSEVFNLEALKKAKEAMEKWKWVGISSGVLSLNIVEIQNA